MSLMSWIKSLVRPVTTARRRWRLEQLEDRMVPTAVFPAHFGPENITQHGGAQMSNAPVYLIFKGPSWGGANTAQTQPYIDAASKLLGSHYLDVTKQYGSD